MTYGPGSKVHRIRQTYQVPIMRGAGITGCGKDWRPHPTHRAAPTRNRLVAGAGDCLVCYGEGARE